MAQRGTRVSFSFGIHYPFDPPWSLACPPCPSPLPSTPLRTDTMGVIDGVFKRHELFNATGMSGERGGGAYESNRDREREKRDRRSELSARLSYARLITPEKQSQKAGQVERERERERG